MKKNNINKHEVICAFYDSTDETKTEHHDFMNILVKHRWRLRPLYFKNNYGSMLQAYATKKILDNNNIPNETIDITANIDFAVFFKFFFLLMIERIIFTATNNILITPKIITIVWL